MSRCCVMVTAVVRHPQVIKTLQPKIRPMQRITNLVHLSQSNWTLFPRSALCHAKIWQENWLLNHGRKDVNRSTPSSQVKKAKVAKWFHMAKMTGVFASQFKRILNKCIHPKNSMNSMPTHSLSPSSLNLSHNSLCIHTLTDIAQWFWINCNWK